MCECFLLVDGAVYMSTCLVRLLVRVGVIWVEVVGVVCMRRRLVCGV